MWEIETEKNRVRSGHKQKEIRAERVRGGAVINVL